jgi:hypothetical protein
MYKKQMFFSDLGDEFWKNSGNLEIPDTFVYSGNSGNCPENMFYRIRSAQQVPPEFQGKIGTFSDIFFRNVTICKKSAKNAKKRKKKCPENTEILVFYRK